MKQFFYFFLVFLSISYTSKGQIPSPNDSQQKAVVLKNATIHQGNGKVLISSASRFEKGKITEVGKTVKESKADVIDLNGQHIYPSFILANNTLGLREIDAVKASRDFQEVGRFNPNIQAVFAYNTESDVSMTVRTNGVLVTQATPRGGLISGTSSVMYLDGWNWEDAQVKVNDAIHLQWPSKFYFTGWWAAPGVVKRNENQSKQILALEKFLRDAQAYSKSSPKVKNLKFEVMKGLFDGSKQMFVNANFANDIINAVKLLQKSGIKKIVICGGDQSHLITDFLKDNNIAVILDRTFSLPALVDDDIDLPYKLPKILQDAGVKYCLAYKGDMEAMGSRNLPFSAGFAVAYGLSKGEALAAITKNVAEILGISNHLGTLEVGKEATLFVSKGDALDIKTNQLTHAFVKGRKVELNNKQIELYKKFKDRK